MGTGIAAVTIIDWLFHLFLHIAVAVFRIGFKKKYRIEQSLYF